MSISFAVLSSLKKTTIANNWMIETKILGKLEIKPLEDTTPDIRYIKAIKKNSRRKIKGIVRRLFLLLNKNIPIINIFAAKSHVSAGE